MIDLLPFAAWLRQRRTVLSLTQQGLALRAGCSASLLRKYERGERRPTRQMAERLAEALELPASQRDAFMQLIFFGHHSGPSSPVDAAPMPITDLYPGHLPEPPTPLIGRDEALAALCQRVLSHPGRLLTLVGPPGVGKTRLAIAAAAALRPSFDHGVCFVDLTPLPDASHVGAALARALGVREPRGGELPPATITLLRPRRALLLLDNFEHVLDAARLVAELLSQCPSLRLIVTSREALQLRAERYFRVAPLALPAAEHASGTGHSPSVLSAPPLTLEEIRRAPAVQLFVACAQTVVEQFTLDTVASAVAAVCARLDGLPLAIELAAARSDELTPAALLTVLDQRLRALNDGPRDLPDHQRTLRRAIDWSYRLLRPADQTLFDRVSVFPGGATSEAVTFVYAGSEAYSDRRVVANRLEGLARKHLLVRQVQADSSVRFMMLETLREYGLERLAASGALEEAQNRYLAYYDKWAERLAPELRGPAAHISFNIADRELSNLWQVLQWAAARDVGVALRVVSALFDFWHARGYWSASVERVVHLLEHAKVPALAPTQHARALYVVGFLASQRSDRSGLPTRYLRRSLALYDELGEPQGMIHALDALGMLARYPGNTRQAQALLETSLGLQHNLGQASVSTLYQLGMIYYESGTYDLAERHFVEGLRVAQILGHPGNVVTLQSGLAEVALARGDSALALKRYIELRDLAHIQASPYGWAHALFGLGRLAALNKDGTAARVHYNASLAICREREIRYIGVRVLCALAQLALGERDDPAAETYAAESLAVSYDIFMVETIAHCLTVQAMIASRAGDVQLAAVMLGAAEGLHHRFALRVEWVDSQIRRDVLDVVLQSANLRRRYQRATEELVQALPQIEFDTAAEAVQMIDLEAVVGRAVTVGLA